MLIAIITAMPEETSAVLACAKSWKYETFGKAKGYAFQSDNNRILLLQGGMGFDNAAKATQTLLETRKPELLVSTGFCGGIAPNLIVGDTVIASEYNIASEGTIQAIPASIPKTAREFAKKEGCKGKRVFSSLFVSVPKSTNKSKIAKLLPDDTPFPVIEMESSAIAIIATEYKIPFIAIRTVSDTRSEELIFTLEEICNSNLQISIPKVLLTTIKRPSIIPQLIRLAKNSKIAANSLTETFASFFLFTNSTHKIVP